MCRGDDGLFTLHKEEDILPQLGDLSTSEKEKEDFKGDLGLPLALKERNGGTTDALYGEN